MQAEGYESLYDGILAQKLLFDQAYVSQDFKKTLLIKSGLKVDKVYHGRVLRDENSDLYVFHFNLNQRDYLVVGIGFSQHELQQLAPKFSNNIVSNNYMEQNLRHSKWSFLFPQPVYANICDPRSPVGTKGFAETKNHLEENEILKGIGRCAMTSFNEIKNSLKEGVSFFKKLATDPRKLWEEMKESYGQFRELVLKIKAEVQQMLMSMSGLTTEQKVQMACGMAGSAMGIVVKSVLGGATSLLTSLPQVALKLKSMTALIKKTQGLSRFGLKDKERNLVAEKVMSCAR